MSIYYQNVWMKPQCSMIGSCGSGSTMNKEGKIMELEGLKALCKYCNKGWKAETLFYCQAQISMAYYGNRISHHYLVIKLLGEQSTMYVKAEKSFCPTGIFVCIDEEFKRDDGVVAFTVDLCGADVCLSDLVAVMKDDDPSYSLLRKNCWQYGRQTAEKILQYVIGGLVDVEQQKEMVRQKSTLWFNIYLAECRFVLKMRSL